MGIETSPYGLRVRTARRYEEAVAATRAALREVGFGVLTEIDVRRVMKDKLGLDFRPYVILGACHPEFSHRALEAELEIGLLLPCNVIVYAEGEGSVVAAMDPVATLGAVAGNPALEEVGREVRKRLEVVLDSMGGP
jgi:uncharacterized protein (DUF302 family)